MRGAKIILGLATLPLALWAHLHLWRLGGFVRWSLVGALATFAVSPTTIMNWQALALLHVAVLPLVFLVEDLLRAPRGQLAGRGVAA